jgi:hypothetical protein
MAKEGSQCCEWGNVFGCGAGRPQPFRDPIERTKEERHEQVYFNRVIKFAAPGAIREQIVPKLGVFFPHLPAAALHNGRQVLIDLQEVPMQANHARDMRYDCGFYPCVHQRLAGQFTKNTPHVLE